MRIRSTKPEFWRSKTIAALTWDVIYDGPLPKKINDIAPMSGTCEYIYMLFDATDSLLYVGRSFRPADRFTKHRRKPWWPRVAGAVIVRVAEIPFHQRPHSARVGPNTAYIEARAISELHPSENIAVASKAAMR